MRDYLFRGKRKDNGECVEGYLVIADERYFIAKCPECITSLYYPDDIYSFTGFVEVIPETVGQFTGLTAENGKVFEGDIVNFKTTAYFFHNCKIEYDICDGCFRAVDRNAQSVPMCGRFIYEVIGNIHDNPELMKGDENK